MEKKHLSAVITIHQIAFPGYFLTELGRPFLRAMYGWYVHHHDAIAHVALADGRVIGFVTGTANGLTYRRSLIQERWLPMSGALVWRFLTRPLWSLSMIGRRRKDLVQAVKILSERWSWAVRQAAQSIGQQKAGSAIPEASLLSIAVLPEVQGCGVALALLAEFEVEARARGCVEATLSVKDDNPRARRFYEKANWKETSCSPNAYGSNSIIYRKRLIKDT